MNQRLSTQGRPVRSIQGKLILYTALAHGLVHVIELTYAALLTRIGAEFGQEELILGVLANAFAFTFGASALPAGVLVDRLGSRWVITFTFLAASVSAFLVGISPSTAVLGVFLALLGLSIGLYHPAGLSLIAQGAAQRGLALGYHGVAGNLGLAVAPALAVGLAVATDWRVAYFFLAALCLAQVVLLRVIHLPEGGRPDPVPQAAASRPVATAPFLPLALVYAVFVINGFVYRGSITWMPAHIEDKVHIGLLGIDESALAGSLTTLALLAGAAGQYVGGNLAQRHTLERVAPLVTMALVPTLLLMGVSGGLLLVAAAATFVFFNFSGQPVYTSLIAEYTPQGAMGRSYGVSFFAAFGLGSSAATVSGFFADRWGTASVFLALAGFALLSLSLATAIWRLSRHPGAVLPTGGPQQLEAADLPLQGQAQAGERP